MFFDHFLKQYFTSFKTRVSIQIRFPSKFRPTQFTYIKEHFGGILEGNYNSSREIIARVA